MLPEIPDHFPSVLHPGVSLHDPPLLANPDPDLSSHNTQTLQETHQRHRLDQTGGTKDPKGRGPTHRQCQRSRFIQP